MSRRATLGALWSMLPQRPSGVFAAHGAGMGRAPPAGPLVPQAPSEPLVTHVDSVAERTVPGLVARTLTGPEPEKVTCAVPSAPVVTACVPAVTVAPGAGLAAPSQASVATLTVAASPGFAVAGTPESRSGLGLTQSGP